MKHLVRAYLAAAPLVWACSTYDYEGMALVSVDQIVVGDTTRLSVVAHDGSTPSASSVAWATSDSAIATVDELGVVTGNGPGWVVIEARTGDYTLETPLLVLATAGPFVSIDGGVDHACALAEDGRAWCWGSTEDGQLGRLFGPERCYVSPAEELGPFVWCSKAAIPLDTELRFTDVAVGYYHPVASRMRERRTAGV